MSERLNIQIKDKNGNLINPATLAELVSTTDGKTVEQRLSEVYALASGATVTKVVPNIAARDALVGMHTGWQVWVVDAKADPTVKIGGAKYLYDADAGEPVDGAAPGAWIKTAEAESMDVVLQWAAMEGIPEVLKKLGLDESGRLTVDGAPVNDGKVGVAVINSGEPIPGNLRDDGLVFEKVA